MLPYGEPGDDWLLLDQERIQDPSGRISNNQVIGLVQVLQERSLQLRDKTNREGLIENEAFHDLKAMARAAIRLFTSYWKKDRPRDETRRATRGGSLELARSVAGALKETASDDVQVDIPLGAAIEKEGIDGGEDATDQGEMTTVTQKEAVDVLIANLDGAMVSAREREERFDRILTLAATGLAAERVVHEFGRQVMAALEALAKVRHRARQDMKPALEVLATCLGTLRNEFRILAPYEAVERGQKVRPVKLREAAELALTINRRFLDGSMVDAEVEGTDLEIMARPSSVVQVLDNLVHNACYWLGTQAEARPRRLRILLDGPRSRVLVVDSGPGVHEEAAAHLFEPFFSMKAGGTGLGLYISGELARQMGASVRLATDGDERPPWAGGATFILEFGPAATTARDDGKVSHGGAR